MSSAPGYDYEYVSEIDAPYPIRGDLDIATVDDFSTSALAYAATTAGTELVFDCTDLSFIGSVGLSALLKISETADKQIVLLGLSDACRRTLRITALDSVFRVAD